MRDEGRSPQIRKIKAVPSFNVSNYRGKRCYDNDTKPRWMNSCIDLSQPEIVNIGHKPDRKELDTSSNFNVDNSNFRRSAGFIPLEHPYSWNPKKKIFPIRNNSLMRTSEDVNLKVFYAIILRIGNRNKP